MDVAIVPCQTYDHETCLSALRAVLAPFGGLDWVQPGMKIAVKANLVSMMKPEAAGHASAPGNGGSSAGSRPPSPVARYPNRGL